MPFLTNNGHFENILEQNIQVALNLLDLLLSLFSFNERHSTVILRKSVVSKIYKNKLLRSSIFKRMNQDPPFKKLASDVPETSKTSKLFINTIGKSNH